MAAASVPRSLAKLLTSAARTARGARGALVWASESSIVGVVALDALSLEQARTALPAGYALRGSFVCGVESVDAPEKLAAALAEVKAAPGPLLAVLAPPGDADDPFAEDGGDGRFLRLFRAEAGGGVVPAPLEVVAAAEPLSARRWFRLAFERTLCCASRADVDAEFRALAEALTPQRASLVFARDGVVLTHANRAAPIATTPPQVDEKLEAAAAPAAAGGGGGGGKRPGKGDLLPPPPLTLRELKNDVKVAAPEPRAQPGAASLRLSDKAPFLVARIGVDVLARVEASASRAAVADLLLEAAQRQLAELRTLVPAAATTAPVRVAAFHFTPPQLAHPITAVYALPLHPGSQAEQAAAKEAQAAAGEGAAEGAASQLREPEAAERRRVFHRAFLLPPDRPLLRTDFSAWLERPLSELVGARLVDLHLHVKPSGVQGGRVFTVDGHYAYHHYMQDRFNDAGWGCAYRTLQTQCSWLQLQHHTTLPPPDHREVQRLLVKFDDKDPSLEGSREWIGAIELSVILRHRYGVEARTLFVASGEDVPSQARVLARHFHLEGTPVMIGGGMLAYGLLGIDFNEKTGEIMFLILDPHYTESEDLSTILKKGWCGWKKASDVFLAKHFYNFCMPLRPRTI